MRLLRSSPDVRVVAVAIRRGEQLAEMSELTDALRRVSESDGDQGSDSLALPRGTSLFFQQNSPYERKKSEV